MELHIANPDPKYAKAKLIEPTTRGYIYVAAAVSPRLLPIILPGAKRSRLLARLKELARELKRDERVVEATVFRAIVLPPTIWFSSYLKERKRASMQVANFDVMVLIQTTSPATAREVQTTPAYDALVEAIRSKAKALYIVAAHNVKHIGDVDTTRKGLFLFNHFAADDADVMFELWDYLADWYAKETGLTNSVAMAPLDGEKSDYAIVNWARWETGPLRHFWRQLSKKSFWRYVTVNLETNRAGSMPVYCRLT